VDVSGGGGGVVGSSVSGVNGSVGVFAAPPLLVSPSSAGGVGVLKGKAVGGFSGESMWSSSTQSGW